MKVKLHSNERAPAEATDATIKALPRGGYLVRDEDQEIVFDTEGLAEVRGGDQNFLRFALKKQGYVKEVY